MKWLFFIKWRILWTSSRTVLCSYSGLLVGLPMHSFSFKMCHIDFAISLLDFFIIRLLSFSSLIMDCFNCIDSCLDCIFRIHSIKFKMHGINCRPFTCLIINKIMGKLPTFGHGLACQSIGQLLLIHLIGGDNLKKL